MWADNINIKKFTFRSFTHNFASFGSDGHDKFFSFQNVKIAKSSINPAKTNI